MYNFLARNGQYIAWGLGLLISVIFVVAVLVSSSGFDAFDLNSAEGRKQFSDAGISNVFMIGLVAALVLTVLTFLVILALGSITSFLSNPKGFIKGLIGVAIVLGIFGICWAIGAGIPDSAGVEAVKQKFEVGNAASGFISGGLLTIIVLLGLTVVAIIGSEIRALIK